MARNKSDDDARPVVYVVDDDRMFCEWLVAVLDTVDVRVVVCETPSEFLATFSNEGVGCIVLDVRLPEMSGLRLHQRLIDDGVAMPVLIITAYGDVSQAVQSIKSGAVDYIQKPATAQALLDRIQTALSLSVERQKASAERSALQRRFATLSPREDEVLALLLEGKTTKQISAALGIGLTTVDFHRNNILKKMRVDNVVELAQAVIQHNQTPPAN